MSEIEYETAEPYLPAVPDEPYPSRFWTDDDDEPYIADPDEECLIDPFTDALARLDADLLDIANFDWERG